MKDLNVGTVLAFLCPGVVGLLGLAYHFPVLRAIVDSAQAAQQSIGVFLFATLLALAIGVVVSGLRALSIDPLVCSQLLGKKRIPTPNIQYAKLKDPPTLAAFSAAVEAYYRYYQFYSNMAVALAFLALSRALSRSASQWPRFWPVLFTALIVLLIVSASQSMRRYSRAIAEITT